MDDKALRGVTKKKLESLEAEFEGRKSEES